MYFSDFVYFILLYHSENKQALFKTMPTRDVLIFKDFIMKAVGKPKNLIL